MKKSSLIVGGIVLLIVIVALLILLPSGEQENEATVIEVINKVDARPYSRDDWRPAFVDMLIYGGGQVRTGADSSACLKCVEGVVRLDADVVCTIKESVTNQGSLLTTLLLQEGRLWALITTDEPHEFTVETGNAIAAARDTFFTVMAEAGGRTAVSVAQGAITLTAQEQSVTVAAGQQAIVEPGLPPTAPEPMSDEERSLWLAASRLQWGDSEVPALTLPTATPEPPTPTNTPTPEPTATPIPTQTLTPTPTITPTPEPTPTPVEPEITNFAAEDGQELEGMFYPPPVCPAPLTVLYLPWVRGDKDDFEAMAALLPDDLSYGALAITPRGCEGGCDQWDPAGWSLDYLAAVDAVKELPCMEESPIVTIGSSVGADGAVFVCGEEETCLGALAFSAGGYLGPRFADLVETTIEQRKHVWAVLAQGDEGATQLDRPEWRDYYQAIVLPGSEHGDELYDSSIKDIIRDFFESVQGGPSD